MPTPTPPTDLDALFAGAHARLTADPHAPALTRGRFRRKLFSYLEDLDGKLRAGRTAEAARGLAFTAALCRVIADRLAADDPKGED